MSIDSMSITNPKQVTVFHHEVLNDDVGVLVNFILFIHCESFPIAEGILGDEIERFNVFAFGVLGKQLAPLQRRHLEAFLRFGLGMLGLLRLVLIFSHLFFDFVLVLAQCADGLLVEFLLLGVGVGECGISKEIQIFDLHVDADLGGLLEVGEGGRIGRYLLVYFQFGVVL